MGYLRFLMTGMTARVSIILIFAESCLDHQMTITELIITVIT